MATIKDVAERAGVSVATVSRMMNKKNVVSEKTQRKIRRVMEELHYEPNAVAQALQTQKSHIVGMIVPSIAYAYFSAMIDAVEQSCYEKGYKLMLCRSGYEEKREQEMLTLLRRNRVDGVLVCSHAGNVTAYQNLSLPIVSIDRMIAGVPSVASDNEAGGVLAARALAQAGSRHPIMLSGQVPDYMEMSRRCTGFLAECGADTPADRIRPLAAEDLNRGDFSDLAGYLRTHPEADGIFADGDVVAAKLYRSMNSGVLQDWKHLPLVGFDGLPVSEWMGISTVAQPIREIGTTAVDLLLGKMEGKVVPERSLLPVRYIRRETT